MYVDSADLLKVVDVLKKRFPNLQAREAIEIGTDILTVLYPEMNEDEKVGGTD